MIKQKINNFVAEFRNHDLDIVSDKLAIQLNKYIDTDYENYNYDTLLEIHYLYDILYFIKECRSKNEFYSWCEKWKNEINPCRFKISDKYKLQ